MTRLKSLQCPFSAVAGPLTVEVSSMGPAVRTRSSSEGIGTIYPGMLKNAVTEKQSEQKSDAGRTSPDGAVHSDIEEAPFERHD